MSGFRCAQHRTDGPLDFADGTFDFRMHREGLGPSRHFAVGVGVVLAHAERYGHLSARPEMAQRWVESGAILQVNAGALT